MNQEKPLPRFWEAPTYAGQSVRIEFPDHLSYYERVTVLRSIADRMERTGPKGAE